MFQLVCFISISTMAAGVGARDLCFLPGFSSFSTPPQQGPTQPSAFVGGISDFGGGSPSNPPPSQPSTPSNDPPPTGGIFSFGGFSFNPPPTSSNPPPSSTPTPTPAGPTPFFNFGFSGNPTLSNPVPGNPPTGNAPIFGGGFGRGSLFGSQPPQTPTQPMPPSQSTPPSGQPVSAAERSLYLSLHNQYRADHCADPVTWNNNLASNQLDYLQQCTFVHDSELLQSLNQGENLYASTNLEDGAQQAITNFYNEVSLYDFENPGFSVQTGHFTQLVWKETDQIGCAAYVCDTNSPFGDQRPWIHIGCRYTTPGNVEGQFEENVLPKETCSSA